MAIIQTADSDPLIKSGGIDESAKYATEKPEPDPVHLPVLPYERIPGNSQRIIHNVYALTAPPSWCPTCVLHLDRITVRSASFRALTPHPDRSFSGSAAGFAVSGDHSPDRP